MLSLLYFLLISSFFLTPVSTKSPNIVWEDQYSSGTYNSKLETYNMEKKADLSYIKTLNVKDDFENSGDGSMFNFRKYISTISDFIWNNPQIISKKNSVIVPISSLEEETRDNTTGLKNNSLKISKKMENNTLKKYNTDHFKNGFAKLLQNDFEKDNFLKNVAYFENVGIFQGVIFVSLLLAVFYFLFIFFFFINTF